MAAVSLTNEDARLGADTLRMLAVDAVEAAASGHPGLPMGAADYAFLLWHSHLRFDPADPEWPGRDRFILSAGHGSMLLYGLLHLFGFDLPLDELKRFRQWGSRTPGHPEYGHTPGVEVTTGPLGQGFAMGVGMALAARMGSARFADERFDPCAHHIYALVSDGDLMEGVSQEAASLAGHLKLGNLVYLYDDNRITIEGSTDLAFSEDTAGRFAALGWHVQAVDGHDVRQVDEALWRARVERERPSLIIARTHIAQGSPGKHDSAAAHGSPLGAEEAAATRRSLGWPDELFHVPERIRELCEQRREALAEARAAWQDELRRWRRRNSDKGRLWDLMAEKGVPRDLESRLLAAVGAEAGATRSLAGKVLQAAAAVVPSLVGGSADLEPSTNTRIKDSSSVLPGSYGGRNLHFGVREHAMAAIMNGMARHGGFIPYGATFLVFADYCRPAIRLAALMKQQAVYVFTHDSLFVGEDGPTHQPVEQLSSLRLIPNLRVIRPADGPETALAWAAALRRTDGPTALVLTRQKVPAIAREETLDPRTFAKGGYVVRSGGAAPAVVLMASGSEVGLALAAAEIMAGNGVAARVVSIPCMEAFLAQPESYRRRCLPGRVPRVAVEAGHGGLWWRLLGPAGLFIGLETFGASAPEKVLAEQYGFTPELVARRVAEFVER
ncbi:transketolase [Geobacter sulfurreducens]|uniref:Transketolase n=1 Tax=Geobacter sulfurreducens (strain ATCC 51573 / DSM 12127 / PCA) TaxID=243231 RepID=Q746U5_GEOSL|nr:transketolase [Geobacter sulfurreducens]AAR36813.1 transketolase [Geobacter sulfurreducens PCA]AJY69674.1 transketolase [Geobacter sulfurreducens]UAC04069.1 transketolase [Geobacter sulfurreducens]HCD97131.1 transketolase [Geobacter sulfurreducens]